MKLDSLNISYGSKVIYSNFSAEFTDHQTTVILGPSGCGKTTLLNAIAKEKGDGGVSFIFQEPRLLPWHTLEKNIMLVLEGNEYSHSECRERARSYLDKVGLGNRAGEYPDRLSGGERQRASIARAFSFPAPVLLMDEPFQSQDPALKIQLINLVKELQSIEKRTVIAVTHNIHEAVALADRAIVLSGRPVKIIYETDALPDLENNLAEVLSCQTSMW